LVVNGNPPHTVQHHGAKEKEKKKKRKKKKVKTSSQMGGGEEYAQVLNAGGDGDAGLLEDVVRAR